MSESSAEKKFVFAAYKGMGTVSMWMGVPLLPLLLLLVIALVTGFGGLILFGMIGLLGPFICALIIFGLKVICENDNKALEGVKWTFRAWKLRFKKMSRVLTVSSNSTGAKAKHDHFYRYLKKVYRSK